MAHILVVDDTKNIRKMVELTLRKAGHEVRTAEDGLEGLQLFGDGAQWDLTLLDQQMPGLQGNEFVVQARQRDPSARLLMMTAFATPELAAGVLQAGALDFLRKPFSTDTLRQAVELALSHPKVAATPSALDPNAPVLRPGDEGYSTPHVSSRVNGYSFWPVSDGQPNPVGFELGRRFEVRLPDGAYTRCFVGITPHVRAEIEGDTGQPIPPDDPFWEETCHRTLFSFLADKSQTPPDILPVYDVPGARAARRGGLSLGGLFGR